MSSATIQPVKHSAAGPYLGFALPPVRLCTTFSAVRMTRPYRLNSWMLWPCAIPMATCSLNNAKAHSPTTLSRTGPATSGRPSPTGLKPAIRPCLLLWDADFWMCACRLCGLRKRFIKGLEPGLFCAHGEMHRIAKIKAGLVPVQCIRKRLQILRLEVFQSTEQPDRLGDFRTFAVTALQHPNQLKKHGNGCGAWLFPVQ